MSTTVTSQIRSGGGQDPKTQPVPSQKNVRKQRTLPKWFNLVAGAIAIGISATFLVFGQAEPDYVGAGLVAAFIFLVVAGIAGYIVEGRRYGNDRIATNVIVGAFVMAVIPLVSLLYTVIVHGWEKLSSEGYLTATTFGSSDPSAIVGAGHAIVGTLLITGVTALISIPFGVLTAVYLVEYGRGTFARVITFLVDVMTGIPSIVAGLFAAAMIPMINMQLFGSTQFKSGFMGSVALVVLMTPIVVRNTEEMLRLVPKDLREASYALGVSKSATIVKIVLRTSLSGIVSGIVIAVARVIGESAPLLITAGTTDVYNMNMFEGQMLTLPVYVYNEYTKGSQVTAWAGALLLILIVLILNLLARWIAKRFAPKGE
ncbi:phosphate ABC transporter permease PstA [Arcanobacterium bovis]|uniref:Phosphate transport system permease protein PstA n=1 Tax=Arcanobacterium bovis TaxID=2529275 RepID=A0A4Q9UZK6_9ACTO|nr:phosphate ABC transporter permease PstA [Arcanobacterium bovis]TBW21459.1 phosphate ABC transporter permease PstA [Arcanobacterium bovis]